MLQPRTGVPRGVTSTCAHTHVLTLAHACAEAHTQAGAIGGAATAPLDHPACSSSPFSLSAALCVFVSFSYVDLVNVHLSESFLSLLPPKMSQWIDPKNPELALMERPDIDNSFVVFKVREDIESYVAQESGTTRRARSCTRMDEGWRYNDRVCD